MQKVMIAAMKPEKKRIAYANLTSVSTTGVLGDISAQIVAGTTQATRVGSKIHYLSMYLNYGWAQADVPIQTVRLMMVHAKQALVIGDFPTSGTVGIQQLFDTNKGKILYDKVHSFNSTITGTTMDQYDFRAKISLVGRVGQWVNGATSGSPIRGNIYLFAVSDSSVVTHPILEYGISISYYDA